jgi:hypothetical protein
MPDASSNYLNQPLRSRSEYLAGKRFSFPCETCDGNGTYRISSDAPWIQGHEVTCEECHGDGVVEYAAPEAFEEAISRMMHSRNMFHLNWKGNRMIAWNHHSSACHWLRIAREADSILAEMEHAGAGHIGREAA